jgi:hypothetical protein
MTASTPDELIAGFPYSSLPKVTGEPTFEDLKFIRRILNTNAMSVASYEGGGRHGHLGIIMNNEEYVAIAVDVFPMPANPGPSAAWIIGCSCGGHDGSRNRQDNTITSLGTTSVSHLPQCRPGNQKVVHLGIRRRIS